MREKFSNFFRNVNPVILILLIMAGAFVASCVFEVNVVYIVIICGLLGVLRTCMSRKGAGK